MDPPLLGMDYQVDLGFISPPDRSDKQFVDWLPGARGQHLIWLEAAPPLVKSFGLIL